MHELIEQDLHFGDKRGIILPPGLTLSIQSQIKLKEFHDYMDACRTALNDIRIDFSLLDPDPCCPASFRVSERLQKFYLEADSWQLDSLVEIPRSLQLMIIESRGRVWGEEFWTALYCGLAMLSMLLDQCESEFYCRLAIVDMLDRINQISWN
jgi:hypothetical protein